MPLGGPTVLGPASAKEVDPVGARRSYSSLEHRRTTRGSAPEIPMPTTPPKLLLQGLAFGESPRWHEGQLWFSNWGTQEIVAVDPGGRAEVIVRVPTTLPYCIDWLPDGRLLVVSGQERLLLRLEPDGALVTHADLTHISNHGFNEIVVDGRGNIYINGGGPWVAASPAAWSCW
jgi:sugar lactone lactonase YvrE